MSTVVRRTIESISRSTFIYCKAYPTTGAIAECRIFPPAFRRGARRAFILPTLEQGDLRRWLRSAPSRAVRDAVGRARASRARR